MAIDGAAREPSELRAVPVEEGLLRDAIAAGYERIGLDGVLAERGQLARRARVPGSAVARGFRWRLADQWTRTWWPQGVSAGEHDGIPLVITSWYAQAHRGREQGARITIVDLRDERRPRYHHVLLVSPRREGGVTEFEPVRVHAGGIAWSGDRLIVAATFGGIREFRLADILRSRDRGMFGYRHVLPQVGRFEPAERGRRFRYSFIALEAGDSADEIRLVAGEYAKDDRGRLSRLRLGAGETTTATIHAPGIPHMQGAVVHDGTWFVSASRGDRLNGDLWVGTPGDMVRHEGALPPGPEDLATGTARDELWSVSEFPGKRWVFAVNPQQRDEAELS